jgi:hypothetical protein
MFASGAFRKSLSEYVDTRNGSKTVTTKKRMPRYYGLFNVEHILK